MKGDEMLDAMGNIEPKIIEEADKGEKKKFVIKPLLAVCLVAAVLVVLISLGKGKSTVLPSCDSAEQTEPVDQTEEIKDTEETKPTAILYSELGIPDDVLPQEVTSVIEQTGGAIEPVVFSTYLETADGIDIIEGEITGIYAKRYDYTLWEKQGMGEKKIMNTCSIIYEMKIERVWRGDYTVGETLLIEDEIFSHDYCYYMLEGHSYVVPLSKGDDEIYLWTKKPNDLVEGELTRDSVYSTGYIYHPQIERTPDGSYLITEDWPILTEGGIPVVTKPVVPIDYIKVPCDLFLQDCESFEEKMKELLRKY